MTENNRSSAEKELVEVFKAARVLLEAKTEDQGVIIPTLAFARCVGLRWGECDAAKERLIGAWDSHDWEQVATDFNRFYTTCTPVGVVDGVPFIRRKPLSVNTVLGTKEDGVPAQAFIDIYRSAKTTTGSEVATAYRKALVEKDIPWEEGCTRAATTHEFLDDSLHITAASTALAGYTQLSMLALGENRQEWTDCPKLPSPEWIKVYYEALKLTTEFKQTSGKSGRIPEPYNLIPAYAAYCLKYSYSKREREIHEMLNKHVLCMHWKEFPVYDSNSSATHQLRDAIKTFEGRFEAALSSFILYFPPYFAYEE